MTQEEINRLPTILDILDSIAMKEEQLRNNPRWGFFTLDQKGKDKFEIVQESLDGPFVLKPTFFLFDSYFRGQTAYYNKCAPTLYRNKDSRDDIDRFIERVRSCEFEMLIDTHPFVNYVFNEGVSLYIQEEIVDIKLKVDGQALAQHYELQTDLMDFTSSKWTAAFFAVCKKQGDNYLPMEDGGYGVFYHYRSANSFPTEDNEVNKNKFSLIGLQPFSRPEEQKASTLKLTIDDDLNNYPGVDKYIFKHDYLAAQIIYNRLNKGDDLFPEDMLTDYADKIRKSRKLSVAAFHLAIERYPFPGLDEKNMRQAFTELNIKLVNYPIVKFPSDINRKFKKDWIRKGEKEFMSKIVYRKYIKFE